MLLFDMFSLQICTESICVGRVIWNGIGTATMMTQCHWTTDILYNKMHQQPNWGVTWGVCSVYAMHKENVHVLRAKKQPICEGNFLHIPHILLILFDIVGVWMLQLQRKYIHICQHRTPSQLLRTAVQVTMACFSIYNYQ